MIRLPLPRPRPSPGPSRHPRLAAALAALLLLAPVPSPGQAPAQEGTEAEEPLPPAIPYAVEIAPTDNEALDDALAAASRLVQLQEQGVASAFGLVARATDDRERLARALHSLGYWGGSVAITLAGLPLGSPDLAERLEAPAAAALAAAGAEDAARRPLEVRITAAPGPRYTIASVSVRPETPEGAAAIAAATEAPMGLAPGDPAAAAPVLDAEERLIDRLLRAGHPLARVVRRETLVTYDRQSMEVAWTIAPGPRAAFAPPAIAGAERVDPAFLARFAARDLAGETFSPQRLEQARRRILALGPFASVRAERAGQLTPGGDLPVTFMVTERPRRAFGVTAAYETNYGPSIRVYWEHRNLFGRAERLRLSGEVARLGTGGDIVEDSVYRAFATLRMPGLFGRDLTLVNTVGALRERLDSYDRDAIVASAILERRLSERLTVGAGPTLDFGEAGPPDGPLSPYRIIGIEFNARWDTTNSLLDPTRGYRVIGTVAPSYDIRGDAPFLPSRVTASTYLDVTGDGRSVLALRTSVGSLLGANRLTVPQHRRFFAGGGGSVRGYDYLSIGPRDAQNRPLGGGSVLEASVEWRQRFLESWGAVAFLDAGTVSTGSAPDTSNLRVGAGLGLRYYTAIGPIRIDAALPLVEQENSSDFGVYVGIGQAF